LDIGPRVWAGIQRRLLRLKLRDLRVRWLWTICVKGVWYVVWVKHERRLLENVHTGGVDSRHRVNRRRRLDGGRRVNADGINQIRVHVVEQLVDEVLIVKGIVVAAARSGTRCDLSNGAHGSYRGADPRNYRTQNRKVRGPLCNVLARRELGQRLAQPQEGLRKFVRNVSRRLDGLCDAVFTPS
jgi:hypothetical protein